MHNEKEAEELRQVKLRANRDEKMSDLERQVQQVQIAKALVEVEAEKERLEHQHRQNLIQSTKEMLDLLGLSLDDERRPSIVQSIMRDLQQLHEGAMPGLALSQPIVEVQREETKT